MDTLKASPIIIMAMIFTLIFVMKIEHRKLREQIVEYQTEVRIACRGWESQQKHICHACHGTQKYPLDEEHPRRRE